LKYKIRNIIIIGTLVLCFVFLSGTAFAGDSGTWYSKDKTRMVKWAAQYGDDICFGQIKKYKKVSGKYKLVKYTSFGIKDSYYYGERLKVKNKYYYMPYDGSGYYNYFFIYTSRSPNQYYVTSYRQQILRQFCI
jgi:hypothetical protein